MKSPFKLKPINKAEQQGMILVAIISIMIFLGVIMIGVFSLTTANLSRSRARVMTLQAQYTAESGTDAALAILNSANDVDVVDDDDDGDDDNNDNDENNNNAYTGTTSDVIVLETNLFVAKYSVAVTNGANAKEKILTAVGKVYMPKTAGTPKYQRTIRVTAQRSSGTTASSILSRNILSMDSGVKNVSARDIHVNGFISMAKNTTNLIAENITVAGKNTGATNCSIGGSGNLVKPSTFSNPGQTKTSVKVAYNNCINPPGNSSNANFDVLANQTNIGTVASTYIPWSYAMDSSYLNANNCTDWTSGASPRSIPSTGNAKKTHYPDSGSGVLSSCGSSGSLALGSNTYTIKDHVHVRASLCKASECFPTFNNPDVGVAGLKFVFVEGTINFGSVHTSPGSGPIVFVAMGADTGLRAGMCPYGDAMYLGHDDTTSAPAAYFIAQNGLCLEKTKFSTNPALGGVGGKNVYIATNPGTPFDLKMDVNFPVSSIPIDLSWRSVYYQKQ